MTIEKKFFAFVAHYNKEIVQGKKWFVAYYVPDYYTGKFKKKKYYGEINKYDTVDERLAECERIKKLIQENKPLPNLRGARHLQIKEVERNFAAAIELMLGVLKVRKSTVDDITYSCYKSKVLILEKWLYENNYQDISIGKFSIDMAKDFLSHLKQQGYANNTYNGYKILFGSLWHDISVKLNGILKVRNIWREIRTLKKITQPYKIYPTAIEKLIVKELPVYDPQLWLFVEFTHYGFIRGTENKKLKIDDIDFQRKTITITSTIAKTNKQRIVAIPEHLYKELMERRLYDYDRDYYIFSRKKVPSTVPAGTNYFRYRWRKFREAFNIPAEYKIYAAKHLGMIKANMGGIDVKEIQLQTGHHSLDQVNEYLAAMNPEMLSNLRAKFPKLGETPKKENSNDELKLLLMQVLQKLED